MPIVVLLQLVSADDSGWGSGPSRNFFFFIASPTCRYKVQKVFIPTPRHIWFVVHMSEEERYLCLECGHRFPARKPVSEHSTYVRCSKCRSYWIVPLREFIKSKETALELIERTTFGMVPLWDVIQAVFLERGIKLYPRLTLRLCAALYSEIVQEKGWV